MAADKGAEKAADKKAESAPDAAAAPKPGTSKIVVILTALNVFITVGVAAIVFLQFKKENAHQKPSDIHPEDESHLAEEKDAGGSHGGGGGDGHGSSDAHGGGGKEKSGASKFGKVLVLDQFVINLSPAGSVNPKYARVNISLELPGAEVENEIQQKMPQVRNAIIDIFNSKKPSDLATTEGRNYLKEEIRNALNNFLSSGKVKSVFFTNFAVTG